MANEKTKPVAYKGMYISSSLWKQIQRTPQGQKKDRYNRNLQHQLSTGKLSSSCSSRRSFSPSFFSWQVYIAALIQERAWTWNYSRFAESTHRQMVDLAAAARETASEVSVLFLSLLWSHLLRLRPAQESLLLAGPIDYPSHFHCTEHKGTQQPAPALWVRRCLKSLPAR